MSNKLKRVKCSLYLDPVNSESDRYAFNIMKRWVHEQMQLVENPASGQELHENLHKHKGIYLSGLYLYLLSPALTNMLSSSLLPEEITMKVLGQKLEMCGLIVPGSNENAPPREDSARLEHQLNHMQRLFSEQLSHLSEMVQESVHQSRIHDDESQISNEQSEWFSDKLAHLEGLIEESLSRSHSAGTDSAMGSDQSQEIIDKLNVLSEIVQNSASQSQIHSDLNSASSDQAKEIAELKALVLAQNQMLRSMKHNAVQATISPMEEAPVIEDLNETIANVKKIKKKGLF